MSETRFMICSWLRYAVLYFLVGRNRAYSIMYGVGCKVCYSAIFVVCKCTLCCIMRTMAWTICHSVLLFISFTEIRSTDVFYCSSTDCSVRDRFLVSSTLLSDRGRSSSSLYLVYGQH